MNLHEVIGFPTHLGYPGSIIWSLSTLIAIFSYHCVCRALTSRPYPHTSRNNHVRLMVINFFSALKPIIALHGCFPVVVISVPVEFFPVHRWPQSVLMGLFFAGRAAEQKISSSFVREFSDGRKRAEHIAQGPF